MEHYDEEILKAQKKAASVEKARHTAKTVEEERKQSIYDDHIEIFRIPTKFDDLKVLNGHATIRMPVDFEPRSEAEIKIMFPSGNPPQELYGNSYSYFIIAFNWTNHEMSVEGIPELMPFAKQLMERMGPKARVIKSDIKQRENGNMGVMEVVANAYQGVSYSYIFYAILEGRLLIGTVMFDRKYKDRLLPIAEEIVDSFSPVEEGASE